MAAADPSRGGRALPAVKFCGLTRPEDAARGAALGARYLGVIFAGGPRLLTAERARALFDAAPGTYGRVGVFGTQPLAEVVRTAGEVGLDGVQLHGDPDPATVAELRTRFHGRIWAVARTAGVVLPDGLDVLFATADAVVLDARVEGALGGTGVALDWERIAAALDGPRAGGNLVLAGGLTAANVARAVRLLEPDVVDVSSGVERSPGIKDPIRMDAFVAALG